MADDLQQQRVLNFFDAFYGGDTEEALKACTDDVQLMVHLPVELFPDLGPRRGKQAVTDLIDIYEARYTSRLHKVRFVVANRQHAAAIVDVTFTKRSDGRVLKTPSGNFFSFRGGLISGIHTFFDAIDMIFSQLTGRDLASPPPQQSGLALRPPKPRLAPAEYAK